MSKSSGNVVCPIDLSVEYGNLCVRLYFLSKGPLEKDITFDSVEMIKVYNSYIEKYGKIIIIIKSQHDNENI